MAFSTFESSTAQPARAGPVTTRVKTEARTMRVARIGRLLIVVCMNPTAPSADPFYNGRSTLSGIVNHTLTWLLSPFCWCEAACDSLEAIGEEPELQAGDNTRAGVKAWRRSRQTSLLARFHAENVGYKV